MRAGAAVLVLWAGSATAEPLRLATGNGYAPYTDSDLPNGGLATAIVRAAFEAADREVAITFVPWRRAYRGTLSHRYAAAFPYVGTPDRRAEVRYSDAVHTAVGTAHVRRNSGLEIDESADLHGLSGCLANGYGASTSTRELYRSGAVRRVSPPTLRTCFDLLERGRVDFVEAGRLVGRHAARAVHGGSGWVRPAGIELSRETLHLIVADDHPDSGEILRTFNKGLKILRRSGQYRGLAARHSPP